MTETLADAVTISLNGASHTTAAPTIAALVEELGLPLSKVAVERNREIVPKSTFASAALSAGDRIEIVHFVGGG